jgi:hypothetical protein
VIAALQTFLLVVRSSNPLKIVISTVGHDMNDLINITLIEFNEYNIKLILSICPINTPASYSGDPGFRCRPGDRLS